MGDAGKRKRRRKRRKRLEMAFGEVRRVAEQAGGGILRAGLSVPQQRLLDVRVKHKILVAWKWD